MISDVRYKLSPQLKFYDEIQNDWKPYVMFKQPGNIRNNVIRTDNYGLRYTVENDNQFSYTLFDQKIKKKEKKQIAIVGGSTAFGVGASNNSKTLSSCLASITDYDVFNLGFRAFNHFQELIMFQQVFHRFNNLDTVVLFSGFNDIFLSKYIDNYDLNSVPFYFESEFNNRMNYPINSFLRKILYNILPKNYSRKINWINDSKKIIIKKIFSNYTEISPNEKVFNWREKYDHNFKIWNILSKNLNFRIIFVLQPFINWILKELSKEEKLIQEELKKNNSEKVVKTLNSIKREEYNDIQIFFKKICKKNDFKFVDMNQIINDKIYRDKWFFVDSLHLNDYGYNETATNLLKIIND